MLNVAPLSTKREWVDTVTLYLMSSLAMCMYAELIPRTPAFGLPDQEGPADAAAEQFPFGTCKAEK